MKDRAFPASPVADVSVAIATRNRPAGLRACLDAILAGERLPSELIVVDQGDAATTRELLAEYAGAGGRLRHVVDAGRGLAASRNAALAVARHPVLAMTDDDCLPAPGWLRAIEEAFGSDQALTGIGGRILPAPPREGATIAVSSRAGGAAATHEGRVAPWVVGSGANLAITCQALRSIGGFDTALGVGSRGVAGEDLDVIMRLLDRGARLRFAPDAVVYHERTTRRRRWKTRWGYGHGVGAMAGLRAGAMPSYSRSVIRDWARLRAHLAVQAARRLRPRGVAEEVLVAAGTVAGLRYGHRIRRLRARAEATPGGRRPSP